MNHPAARKLAALTVLAPLATGAIACGVSSQDRPKPVERTSVQQEPAIPSVATEPEFTSRTPTSTVSTVTTRSKPKSTLDR